MEKKIERLEKKLAEYVERYNKVEANDRSGDFYTYGDQERLASVISDLCELLGYDCGVFCITECGWVYSRIDIKKRSVEE